MEVVDLNTKSSSPDIDAWGEAGWGAEGLRTRRVHFVNAHLPSALDVTSSLCLALKSPYPRDLSSSRDFVIDCKPTQGGFAELREVLTNFTFGGLFSSHSFV